MLHFGVLFAVPRVSEELFRKAKVLRTWRNGSGDSGFGLPCF